MSFGFHTRLFRFLRYEEGCKLAGVAAQLRDVLADLNKGQGAAEFQKKMDERTRTKLLSNLCWMGDKLDEWGVVI